MKERTEKQKAAIAAVSVCIALWMIMIFIMSSETASVSTNISHSAGSPVCSAVIPGFDRLDSDARALFVDNFDYFFRKCAHMAEFGILGALFALLMHFTGVRFRSIWWKALACTAVYAVTDEIHQLFVDGRSCQVTDVLTDCAGGIAGILVVMALIYAVMPYKR